jgi:GNAT superfamily N-acetyltransferase
MAKNTKGETNVLQIVQYKNGPFLLSTDPALVQIERVCEFLARSYWANTRDRATIIKSLEHSLCFSLFYEQTQIGLARVITDGATFAYLCDVFIDEKFRGQGLGKWLVECVLQHPDIASVRRVLLATKDAHGLYEQFGFQPPQHLERLMEKIISPSA